MPHSRWTIVFVLCALMPGCATPPRDHSASPLTIAVGPVTFEAPVTKSKQIYTFEENPEPEVDRQLLPVLIEDIEVTAQRLLTEELTKHSGIRVIPFDKTRRLLADIAPARQPLNEAQIQALGQHTPGLTTS